VWTVAIPDEAIVKSGDGRRLDVDVHDVAVIDATPAEIPATVSFQMTWRGTGRTRQLGSGSAVPPTDAAAFLGRLARARFRGTFSGGAAGFTFQSKRRLRTIFAEVGTEQTGALLAGAVRCKPCSR
jgi:hypothetical protein